MKDTSDVFERLNIQSICSFILHGADCITESPKERIKNSKKNMKEALFSTFPDMIEREEFEDKIYEYVSAAEDIFMEIGLQAGIILAFQFLKEK